MTVLDLKEMYPYAEFIYFDENWEEIIRDISDREIVTEYEHITDGDTSYIYAYIEED